jgi:hypothetical protein
LPFCGGLTDFRLRYEISKNPMNCPACHYFIPNDSQFCQNCGFAIPKAQTFGAYATAAIAPPAEAGPALPPFFAVPVWKLALLSFFTLGLYELYWFYRNWQRVRVREQVNISPLLRAFCGVIFCYPCYARMRVYGRARGVTPAPPILLLAIAWTVTTLCWKLPDPGWLISIFSFLFVLPMQSYANWINEEEMPAHDRNARLTAWNWVGIVVGGIFFALVLIGLFAPPR